MATMEDKAENTPNSYEVEDRLNRIFLLVTVHEFGHSFGLDDRGSNSFPNSIMKKGVPPELFSYEQWRDVAKPQRVDFVGVYYPDIISED